MSHKDTIELMRSIASQRGGKCLSKKYVNQRTQLEWQCPEGHTWHAAPSMVKGSRNKSGTWCPHCAHRAAAKKRMYDVEGMKRLAVRQGGAFVSREYLGSQTKHIWKCKEPSHPEFPMTPNSVQQNQWCPKCKKNAKPTLDELNQLARRHHPSARCRSEVYVNANSPLRWQCGCAAHPSFDKPYRSVKFDGGWCALCRKEKPQPTKYSREMLIRFAANLGAALLSDEPYRSTKQNLKWRCPDGHRFIRTLDKILVARSFCPECGKRGGLREQYIRELFIHTFGVPFERTKALPWLINSRGNPMELDGYNAKLSLGFEHNGQQHYEVDGHFIEKSDQLERRQNDDTEKLRLCTENAVAVIVIPFSIPLKEIQAFVLSELKNICVVPKNTMPFEPGVLATSVLATLRRHAARLGGQLLSQRYQGGAAKLLWKCKDKSHSAFPSTPNSVLNNGRWCRKCASERQAESYRVSLLQVQEWARTCKGELIVNDSNLSCSNRGYALADKHEFHCLACGRRQFRTVRQIKYGRLCLCHSKKTRTDRAEIERKLSGSTVCLVGPEAVIGGRTLVTIQCTRCKTQWQVKASSVMNNAVGCPKCKPNASIGVEKAGELGERIGFILRSDVVSSGMDILRWECTKCGGILDKPFRMMRNLRRCPFCVQGEAANRLKPR